MRQPATGRWELVQGLHDDGDAPFIEAPDWRDYLALNDGDLSLSGFRAYVEQRNDRMVILPAGQVTGFDFVIDVQGQRVRLTVPPENLVFMEG